MEKKGTHPFFSRRVVIATGNPGKLREMRAILAGHGLELVAQSEFGIQPPVEDGDSYVVNALIKARNAASVTGLPAIADDSGLEVDALGGRPGIHAARYSGPEVDAEANNDKLLAEIGDLPQARRGARYRCAMVFVRDAADPRRSLRKRPGKAASASGDGAVADSATTRCSSSRARTSPSRRCRKRTRTASATAGKRLLCSRRE